MISDKRKQMAKMERIDEPKKRIRRPKKVPFDPLTEVWNPLDELRNRKPKKEQDKDFIPKGKKY